MIPDQGEIASTANKTSNDFRLMIMIDRQLTDHSLPYSGLWISAKLAETFLLLKHLLELYFSKTISVESSRVTFKKT
jgi:hypothetical protein